LRGAESATAYSRDQVAGDASSNGSRPVDDFDPVDAESND
jgi:hypothetical protein